MKTFKELLKKHLEKEGITPYKLAQISEVKSQRIYEMLGKNPSVPNDENLNKILTAFPKLTSVQKREIVLAVQDQRANNTSNRKGFGSKQRRNSILNKISKNYDIDIDIKISYEHSDQIKIPDRKIDAQGNATLEEYKKLLEDNKVKWMINEYKKLNNELKDNERLYSICCNIFIYQKQLKRSLPILGWYFIADMSHNNNVEVDNVFWDEPVKGKRANTPKGKHLVSVARLPSEKSKFDSIARGMRVQVRGRNVSSAINDAVYTALQNRLQTVGSLISSRNEYSLVSINTISDVIGCFEMLKDTILTTPPNDKGEYLSNEFHYLKLNKAIGDLAGDAHRIYIEQTFLKWLLYYFEKHVLYI